MTTETMTLTAFLLARIADDEAWVLTGDCGCADVKRPDCPDRVLAECEAKRRIVERCADMLAVDYWEYEDAPNLAEEILCDLANVYADHPDCREEWKP